MLANIMMSTAMDSGKTAGVHDGKTNDRRAFHGRHRGSIPASECGMGSEK